MSFVGHNMENDWTYESSFKLGAYKKGISFTLGLSEWGIIDPTSSFMYQVEDSSSCSLLASL